MDEAHLEKLTEALVRMDTLERVVLEIKSMYANDEGAKRLVALERTQDKMGHTLEQINKTLSKFEAHIDELFDVKAKLESIDTAWRRIDSIQEVVTNMDKILSLLASEHQQCKPKIDGVESCRVNFEHRLAVVEKIVGAAGSFIQGRVASLTDKLVWVGFGAAAVVAVVMALKGIGK